MQREVHNKEYKRQGDLFESFSGRFDDGLGIEQKKYELELRRIEMQERREQREEEERRRRDEERARLPAAQPQGGDLMTQLMVGMDPTTRAQCLQAIFAVMSQAVPSGGAAPTPRIQEVEASKPDEKNNADADKKDSD